MQNSCEWCVSIRDRLKELAGCQIKDTNLTLGKASKEASAVMVEGQSRHRSILLSQLPQIVNKRY